MDLVPKTGRLLQESSRPPGANPGALPPNKLDKLFVFRAIWRRREVMHGNCSRFCDGQNHGSTAFNNRRFSAVEYKGLPRDVSGRAPGPSAVREIKARQRTLRNVSLMPSEQYVPICRFRVLPWVRKQYD